MQVMKRANADDQIRSFQHFIQPIKVSKICANSINRIVPTKSRHRLIHERRIQVNQSKIVNLPINLLDKKF